MYFQILPSYSEKQILWYCDVLKWRRQVWKKTAASFWTWWLFIVFQKLKHTFTSFEIQYVWHTAAKEKVFFISPSLLYIYFQKKEEHCEGFKPQVGRQKHDMWSFANTATEVDKQSHFFCEGATLESWRRKILFMDISFCHKYWKVEIFTRCYSVDALPVGDSDEGTGKKDKIDTNK